jgi:hypothetical protein
MSGFEVFLKDRTVTASIGDEGVLSVIISYCNKSVVPENNCAYLSIGGLVSFEHEEWYAGNIDDENKITIRVIDAVQNSPILKSTPQDNAELMKQYRALKNELEAEGLL